VGQHRWCDCNATVYRYVSILKRLTRFTYLLTLFTSITRRSTSGTTFEVHCRQQVVVWRTATSCDTDGYHNRRWQRRLRRSTKLTHGSHDRLTSLEGLDVRPGSVSWPIRSPGLLHCSLFPPLDQSPIITITPRLGVFVLAVSTQTKRICYCCCWNNAR